MNNEEKSAHTLALAAKMSLQYYKKPLIITYSGGKDSDVMLHLAETYLKPHEFEVLNSHTTVDAPQTVYHIREVFKRLDEKGIKTTIQMPTYKGEPTTMWKLIEEKLMPPTRLVRYCCQVLKEASTPNRLVAIGVRRLESVGRGGGERLSVSERKRKPMQSIFPTSTQRRCIKRLNNETRYGIARS